MRALVLASLLAVGWFSLSAAPVAPEVQALQVKAQAGDAEAQFQMGEAFRSGHGVFPDAETAIMWYKRAAAQGHVRAGEELGFALFAHGERHEAMPYIEKAAARGEARAFYLLGTAHFNGDYATRDWPLAYAQTMRAASAGLPAAQRNLELMDRYLLPSDKTKADQILATLPPIRGKAQVESAVAVAPPAAQTLPDVGQAASAKSISRAIRSGGAAKPAGAAVSARDAPEPDGRWKIQLGAFGSAERVQERWKAMTAKVPVLRDYKQNVLSAGSVRRLQATGIASKADAQQLCKKVVAAKGDCLVIAP